jgi:hypothetical protein
MTKIFNSIATLTVHLLNTILLIVLITECYVYMAELFSILLEKFEIPDL